MVACFDTWNVKTLGLGVVWVNMANLWVLDENLENEISSVDGFTCGWHLNRFQVQSIPSPCPKLKTRNPNLVVLVWCGCEENKNDRERERETKVAGRKSGSARRFRLLSAPEIDRGGGAGLLGFVRLHKVRVPRVRFFSQCLFLLHLLLPPGKPPSPPLLPLIPATTAGADHHHQNSGLKGLRKLLSRVPEWWEESWSSFEVSLLTFFLSFFSLPFCPSATASPPCTTTSLAAVGGGVLGVLFWSLFPLPTRLLGGWLKP